MDNLRFTKKRNFVIALNFLSLLIISMLVLFNLEALFGRAEKVVESNKLKSDNLSFNLLVSPEETKVKAGATVEISLNLSDINVGENGLNSIVGNLSYDENLFESMTFVGTENSANDGTKTDKTKWNVELNQIKESSLYGKFCIYTVKEGVKDNQNIAKMTLKLKKDLKPQVTKVYFKNLASSDGDVEVGEVDRVVTIIIYEDEVVSEQPESKPEQPTPQPEENSPQTGDVNIIIALVVLVLTILMDISFVVGHRKDIMRNRNDKNQNNNAKKFLSFILVCLIGFSCVYTATNAEDQLVDVLKKLDVKQTWLNSSDYLVTEERISRIAPGTKVENLTEKLNKNVGIFENENEISKDGVIATGMEVSIKNPVNTDAEGDRKYRVSVWGDLNEDGKSNQVELTTIIRNKVDADKWKLEDVKQLAADLNSDDGINEDDINLSVRYIVYGEMKIPEIKDVVAPRVEVVSGTYNDDIRAYTTDVIVRITENEENAKNTKYMVENSKGDASKYTEIKREKTNSDGKYETSLKITENGVYKISAYTTGSLGNRSEIPYIIVYKTDASFRYKIHYYYDGVENLDKLISGEGALGETINVTPSVEDGNYILDSNHGDDEHVGTEGLPIIISKDVEKNVGKVFYVTKGREFIVTAEVIGGNGKIVNDSGVQYENNIFKEIVYEGQSTKDSIVAKPDDGYRVKEIKQYKSEEYDTIEDLKQNGEVSNINVLGKIKDVRANIHITIEYEVSPFVAQIVRIPSDIDQEIKGKNGKNILNQEYTSLQAAIEDADKANKASKDGNKEVEILILRNIDNESNVIQNNNNIVINLNGCTVNSIGENTSSSTLKIDNCKVTVVDRSQTATGKINNEKGIGIYVTKTGNLTLGEYDDVVSSVSPIIQGVTYGISKENDGGIFNFYDGKIIGGKLVDGYNAYNMQKVDKTPDFYSPVIYKNADGNQESVLNTVSDVEARIGTKRYTRIEDAIADANNLVGTKDDQVEITILRDITMNEERKIVVDGSKNIKLDLNGFVITTTDSDYVIKNYGELEIYDSSAEKTGKILGNNMGTILNSEYGSKEIKKFGINDVNILRGSKTKVDNIPVIYGAVIVEIPIVLENDEPDLNLEIFGKFQVRNESIYLDGVEKVNLYNEKINNTGWGIAHVKLGNVSAGEHTIKCYTSTANTYNTSYQYFVVTKGETRGKLTISGGTIENDKNECILSLGDLYIKDGTVTTEGVGIKNVKASTLDISNGIINGSISGTQNSEMNITGGTFNSRINNNGKLTVSNNPKITSVLNEGTANINGGTFSGRCRRPFWKNSN